MLIRTVSLWSYIVTVYVLYRQGARGGHTVQASPHSTSAEQKGSGNITIHSDLPIDNTVSIAVKGGIDWSAMGHTHKNIFAMVV